MRRREDFPISKHTMFLYKGDYPKIQTLYPRMSAAKVIRDIVRAHIVQVELDASKRLARRKEASS